MPRLESILVNMGLESDEDAQALFDYYQLLKSTKDNPESIIDELIQAIYSTRVVIEEAFKEILDNLEDDEGIAYDDFVRLVKMRGNFKRAFEDTMFSTKVVIKNKEEFIDFIKQLIGAGYRDVLLVI